MDPQTIAAIVQFLEFAGGQIVGLVAHVKQQETVTTIELLAEDLAGFQANNAQIDAWFAAHPAAEIQPDAVPEPAPPAGGSGE